MTLSEAQRLVKSKQRVADHGEVYTPAWMVEDMLNLVKHESERIDSQHRDRPRTRRLVLEPGHH